MLDINQFKTAVQKYDLERPNLFKVDFGMPAFFKDTEFKDVVTYVDNTRHLSLLCRSATMPGRSLALADAKRYGIGPSIRMPTGGQLEEFSLTFLNDADSRTWLFFNKWIEYIYPMGPKQKGMEVVPGQLTSHQLKFKERYQADLKLTTYGSEKGKFKGSGIVSALVSAVSSAAGVPFVGSLLNSRSMQQFNLVPKRIVTFYKAFPTSISSLNYSADTSDTFSDFTVGFTFVNYSGTIKF
jgi:hypothetical protein